MLIIIFILGFIILSLTISLLLSRREIHHIVRQLQELKGKDTNALLHIQNGFIPADLLNEINSLLTETRAVRVQYARKKHALEQMMTNISHDLRTPLTSAMGYIDMILQDNLPDSEKQREITIVAQRLERLRELIQSFFEFSQVIAKEDAPEKTELNLVAVLEEAVAHYYDDYCAKGRAITLCCGKKRLQVFSNQKMLLRIFDNLIGNSFQHGAGELTISVQVLDAEGQDGDFCGNNAATAHPQSPGAARTAPVAIHFANALHGTCPDLEQIFDEFYTTDISRTKGNTGLGLAIAKQFTEILGGNISASYEGGVFMVTVVLV